MVTKSLAIEVAERKRRAAVMPARMSFAEDLRELLLRELAMTTGIRFPSEHYQADPVAFFREILGVEPWSRQIEILNAVRDHRRVAVCSGHKVSKSHSAAGIALWYFCSFPDARVVMTSTTSRQVDQILWRELKMLRARAGRCVDCKLADPDGYVLPRPCAHSALIEDEPGELARTGIKSDDFREIVGFTARESEAVAGVSGRNLLYIVDEASGVSDDIFFAIEGNRAGGARIVLFGNGTRNEGEFFEAFYSKAHLYFTMRVSSEETPNVIEGRDVIPGLATADWIAEKRNEWGEDSPLYQVRVKGLHAVNEEGRIFSLHAIAQAESRWSETPDAGLLYIGCDPAGETGSGDESGFSVRRGMKQIALRTARGLNDEQHIVTLLGLVREFALPRETPVVVVDREGSIGYKLAIKLRAYLDLQRDRAPFELVTVRASDRAARQPQNYDRTRDELIANLEAWFRDGGAIIEDTKLEQELHVLEWFPQVNGRLKVTPKDVIKKALGRSPDRLDALALSCFEPLSLRTEIPDSVAPDVARERARELDDVHASVAAMDPYAGSPTHGGRP